MGEIAETIYMSFVGAISLGFFMFVGGYIIYASNSRWREFESVYPARDTAKPMDHKITGMVRISQPGFRWGHLSGDLKSHRHPPVNVSVDEKGLTLSIVQPFKYGSGDLFLPFDEMTIEPAEWDLLKKAYGVQMERVEGVEILMFDNILEWAAERSEVLTLMLKRAELIRSLEAEKA
ncbi:hypothetical protein [Erythrobacter sp. MTPC3]|uniref:hypothetical protein n=1 Tax=Erythrobacter sp. MTPC3 TaxID=3056564 RepID=UPI0036F23A4D